MNIHEYQAKEIFRDYNITTSDGNVAFSVDEAYKRAKNLNSKRYVVKSQILAGGRGKGVFTDGFQGGVHICDSAEEVKSLAKKMLGNTLVTHQTGKEGKTVNRLYIEEPADIDKEFYFAILLDRQKECPVVIASREGGVDIEEVADKDPNKILRIEIDANFGLLPFQARNLASFLQIPEKSINKSANLFLNVYKFFSEKNCMMVEINPLVLTKDDDLIALDAKIDFDDNALFRHKDISELEDESEIDIREVEAKKYNLNYIGLDGNVGCMVNGAGLAMGTMDIIKHHGGEPANFLDVGGGANTEQVKEAFKILISDKNVKSIIVNIFGGIMKCDIIASGIIEALKQIKLTIPLVVRLEGTNVELGKKLLNKSSLDIISAESLDEAAKKAVELAIKN